MRNKKQSERKTAAGQIRCMYLTRYVVSCGVCVRLYQALLEGVKSKVSEISALPSGFS